MKKLLVLILLFASAICFGQKKKKLEDRIAKMGFVKSFEQKMFVYKDSLHITRFHGETSVTFYQLALKDITLYNTNSTSIAYCGPHNEGPGVEAILLTKADKTEIFSADLDTGSGHSRSDRVIIYTDKLNPMYKLLETIYELAAICRAEEQ